VRTLGTADKLPSIEATLKVSDERAEKRRDDRDETRLERATDIYDYAPTRGKGGIIDASITIGKSYNRALGNLFEAGVSVAGTLFSLLDPPTTPAQRAQAAEKARDEREAQAEASIDFSKYTSDRAQERQNQQEQQASRDRQREPERDR
jgi:hypothetical protein